MQVAPDQITDLSRVGFAICWQPEPGLLQQVGYRAVLMGCLGGVRMPHSQPPSPCLLQCPNLRGVQSMGAGVDSLIGDPTLPRHVPLLRIIDPLM